MTVLRSGLNPKMTLATIALAGAGNLTTEYDTLDMRDSMGWTLSVDQDHPTDNGAVQIDWFIIERLSVRIWTDRFVVPPNGVQIQAKGPLASPFCRITKIIPKQAAASTQMNVYFFGTNQVVDRTIFQRDDALANFANSLGFQNIAIMDPDTLAAGYASVLANNPAFNDSGLVTRPIFSGAYPNRTDVAFADEITSAGVAEAAATLDHYLGPDYAATTGSSYTVPAGKRLRLTAVHLQLIHSAATTFTFRIRETTSLTGDVIRRWRVRLQAAGRSDVVIPLDVEFVASEVLQFSTASGLAGAIFEISLEGFQYDV